MSWKAESFVGGFVVVEVVSADEPLGRFFRFLMEHQTGEAVYCGTHGIVNLLHGSFDVGGLEDFVNHVGRTCIVSAGGLGEVRL